jgi:hypothetical protein
MENFSKEYISSLVLVLTSLFSMCGYKLGNDFIVALVSVIFGSMVMYFRYKKGDIMASGLKKV